MKRRHFLRNAVWFAAGCGAVAACGDRGGTDTGQRPDLLRFSVTDLQGLDPLQRDYGAFVEALSEVINIPVEPVPLASFVAAAPALVDRHMDFVFAGPSEYLLLNARAQAIPVVAVTRPNYRSSILVRADSGIEAIQDLKGKVFGMSSEGATAGHLGASQILADAGLDPLRDLTVRMVGNNRVSALLAGDVDAFAVSSTRTAKLLSAIDGAAEQVKTLIEGPPLPNDVFVAGTHLDPVFLKWLGETMVAQQDKLLAALLQGPENSKYAKSKFAPVTDGDYDQIRTMYQTLGLENLIQ